MLKAWMESRGLTPQELAEMLGVSRQAVQLWVSGKGYPRTPTLAELERLSNGVITARSLVNG